MKPVIQVELYIFSGRPNPKWELSEERAQELDAKLRYLRPIHPKTSNPQLGYLGFCIQNPKMEAGLPAVTWVHRNIISLYVYDRTWFYEDTNDLEEWLIADARQRGYGELIDQDRKRRE